MAKREVFKAIGAADVEEWNNGWDGGLLSLELILSPLLTHPVMPTVVRFLLFLKTALCLEALDQQLSP